MNGDTPITIVGHPAPGVIASTAVLANLAFERAAACPSRSPGRRAAAEACEALTHSSTIATARRRLEALHDPALREAALAVLGELEQLASGDNMTSAAGRTTP